jgi:plastocyanin
VSSRREFSHISADLIGRRISHEVSHRRLTVLAMTLFALLPMSLVSGAETPTVSQRNREFSPSRLSLNRGQTIRVINDDRVTHHVFLTAPGLSFDSGEQPVGSAVELRFDNSGDYVVRCAIHPTMRLAVSVR